MLDLEVLLPLAAADHRLTLADPDDRTADGAVLLGDAEVAIEAADEQDHEDEHHYSPADEGDVGPVAGSCGCR